MAKTYGGIVLAILTIGLVLQSDARMSAADIDDAGLRSMQRIDDVDRGNCYDESRWWVTSPSSTGIRPHSQSGLAEGSCLDLRDELGRTALHYATIQGSCKAVRLLLAAGADVDARDHQGHTALDLAYSSGLWEIANVLTDAGADAESPGTSVGQPGHTATAERFRAANRAPVAEDVVSSG